MLKQLNYKIDKKASIKIKVDGVGNLIMRTPIIWTQLGSHRLKPTCYPICVLALSRHLVLSPFPLEDTLI